MQKQIRLLESRLPESQEPGKWFSCIDVSRPLEYVMKLCTLRVVRPPSPPPALEVTRTFRFVLVVREQKKFFHFHRSPNIDWTERGKKSPNSILPCSWPEIFFFCVFSESICVSSPSGLNGRSGDFGMKIKYLGGLKAITWAWPDVCLIYLFFFHPCAR